MITKAPITTPVVTWPEMRFTLRLDDDAFKQEVERYIEAATLIIEGKTDSTISAREVVATVDAARNGLWALPAGPIISVTSVVDATSATLTGWKLRGGLDAGLTFVSVPNGPLVATYQAGYATPPADLVIAVQQLAKHLFENRSATSATAVTETPFNLEWILKRHKRTRNIY